MTQEALIRQLQDGFWQAAELLMLQHTTPWELDEALEGFGYAIGPCLAQDHLGLAEVLARRQGRSGPLLTRMVAEGRLGKIGGVGFYRYPGGGGAVIDPLIEDLFREEAWFGKIARCDLPEAGLVARMNGALAQACGAGPQHQDWPEILARAVGFPGSRIAALAL